MTVIYSGATLFTLVRVHPCLKIVLYDLGCKYIIKSGFLYTVGLFLSLKKMARLKKIEWNALVYAFIRSGFEIVDTKIYLNHNKKEAKNTQRRYAPVEVHRNFAKTKRRF